MIEADLASGALVQIATEDIPAAGRVIIMSAIYRTDSPPGPAARWFIDYLKQQGVQRSIEKTAIVSVSKGSTGKRQRSANRRSLAKQRIRRR
jgi:hypothetical protein